jgi:hypothetical protein
LIVIIEKYRNNGAKSIIQIKQYEKELEILIAAVTKISIFWDITP